MELVLTAIFAKKDSMLSFYEDNENHDYLYIYDSKDDAYLKVPEWDYSFDDYELDYLEQGYNIVYMPDSTHAAYWTLIDRYYEEIEHREGLIRYLDYCKTHHIYHDYLMESCECELPDIFEFEEDSYIYEPEVR